MIPHLAGLPVPAISSDDMAKLHDAYAGRARGEISLAAFDVAMARPDGPFWFDAAEARLSVLVECLSSRTIVDRALASRPAGGWLLPVVHVNDFDRRQ